MLKKIKQLWTYRKEYLAYTRKAIVNVVGFVAGVLSVVTLPEKYATIVTPVVAVLVFATHYKVSNADAPVIPPDS